VRRLGLTGHVQVLANWLKQASEFTPALNMLKFHGEKEERVRCLLSGS
jgi:hypothetical protein